MCGITGFYSKKIADRDETIQKMTDTLFHRGPDSAGYYGDGDFSMGMRRLSIIDLSTGAQPVYNENKTIAVVFNGEIFNFQTLRENLEKKGHRFYTKTDTEILVHLYEEEGEDFLSKLNGMFAFCIYDKNKKEIFIGRDRMGKKPLYYYCKDGEFVFGSEIKSLLAFPGYKKEINQDALLKYLTFGYVPAPLSIFKNIYKLPAGNQLRIRLDEGNMKLATKEYWDFDFSQKINLSPKEICDRLDGLLSSAVERRLVSDVPLGVFLSGGVDSSLMVSMAAKFMPGKKIKTFSIGFGEKNFDESAYSALVAKKYATEHHLKIFKPSEALGVLGEITDSLDEPISDPSVLPTYLLSRFTREHVTVAISGDGGDEIFGGYPKYYIHNYIRYYDHLPDFIRKGTAGLVSCFPLSPNNKFFNFKVKRLLETMKYAPEHRNQFWAGVFSPEEMGNITENKSYPESIYFEDTGRYVKKFSGDNELDQMMYLDLKLMLQDMYLAKVDRASMAASLEVRSPMLDKEILDFSFQLDSKDKVRGMETKYILKKLAERYLPKEVIYRFKQGFGLPLSAWICGELSSEVASFPDNYYKELSINKNYFLQLIGRHKSGKEDNAAKIWAVYMLLLWYRKFFN